MTVRIIDVIVVPAATSLAVSGLLIWFFKEWIGVRLKAGIQHEYDRKLETHKAELKAQHEADVLDMKATLSRAAALHATAHGSFVEGQKASMERRLNAIDQLWSGVLKLRTNKSPLLGFIDILLVDEYKEARNHPTFKALLDRTSDQEITDAIEPQIEKARPYVGEYLWMIFFCYRAILLRVLFLLLSARTDANKMEWQTDQGIRQLIEAVLSPTEVKEFDRVGIGKISWIQERLEAKILTSAQKVISGESFADDSLDQAKRIQERVQTVSVTQRREAARQ